jgi:hypothetical protein
MQDKLGSRYSNGKRMSMDDWLLVVLATVIGTILAMLSVIFLVMLIAG